MKPRSKRNRKRPRGGIGCLVGDGEGGEGEGGDLSDDDGHLLRVEVVPLSRAFDLISDMSRVTGSVGGASEDDKLAVIIDNGAERRRLRRRVRVVHPYPYTFATFAKARWVGRTVANVYHDEFGSYPREYYEAAIDAGRILVSGRRVDCDYVVRGGDELTHTVHRHEPAVGLADVDVDNDGASDNDNALQLQTAPPIEIVHEDDNILAVDKPATLPIHPCGGYNFNTLYGVLSHWNPTSYGPGTLFTVHRLDRLTSGLVIIAKSSRLASELGKCIVERETCEKIYLARVRGRFPLNMRDVQRHPDGGGDNGQSRSCSWEFRYSSPDHDSSLEEGGDGDTKKRVRHSVLPPCQYGEMSKCDDSWKGGVRVPFVNGDKKNKVVQSNDCEVGQAQSFAGLGYWFSDGTGKPVIDGTQLQDLVDQCKSSPLDETLRSAIGTAHESECMNSDGSVRWLNFSCPCRISSHKNGVCEAGDFSQLTDQNERKGIKPAQTSFALLSYDASSDTSLVVAKPVTGRTHQIRLHLQKLGHPIANDHCYDGKLWFGDEEGKSVSRKSREWLDKLDGGDATTSSPETCNVAVRVAPENSTNADTPATEAEVYQAAVNRPREEGESILDFIKKTCVWCARCRGVDGSLANNSDGADDDLENGNAVFRRTVMEYLVRSQGIWLHALQYSLKTKDDAGRMKTMRYRTKLPSWATIGS